MYVAFIEVLKDLWIFATSLFVNRTKEATDLSQPLSLPPAPVHPNEEKVVVQPSLESKLCFVSVQKTLCLQTPVKKFDSVRGELYYGESVKVLQQRESWSFVETSNTKGWVETRHLIDNPHEIFPELVQGDMCSADNPEVKKLRRYVKDEMLGEELGLALQPSEYILYRLKRLGVNVSWPLERPRLPGSWQSILRDKRGVSLSLEPKTGSILECAGGEKQQFLAYVESVTPDQTIVLSSVGFSESAKYEKDQYQRTQWSQWKPVFIAFT
jgi:hypothetical protein